MWSNAAVFHHNGKGGSSWVRCVSERRIKVGIVAVSVVSTKEITKEAVLGLSRSNATVSVGGTSYCVYKVLNETHG
jgi:hypothetical protein